MTPAHQILEAEFATFNGVSPSNMVACSSGTAALHLALEAMLFPPGSGVLVPEFTMVACARAVTLAGLTPIFVDCDPSTLLITNETVENALERHSSERHLRHSSERHSSTTPVVAVMPVHIYGRYCDVRHSAERHNLTIIEDLAEAHGLLPATYAHASCWSFYKNKIIAGEEGGAVYFRDAARAALARSLRCQGFTENHDFYHIPRGHNYRLADTLAQLILDGPNGLRNYSTNLDKRIQIVEIYDNYCPPRWRMPERDAPWVYDLRIPGGAGPSLPSLPSLSDGPDGSGSGLPDGAGRLTAVVQALRQAGIEARHGFKPMSWQREYATPSERTVVVSSLPWNAARASQEVLYLPLYPQQPLQPLSASQASAQRAFSLLAELCPT